MEHILKTDPDSFQAVWSGRKRAEIRINDRKFRIGQRLTLAETKYTAEKMKEGMELRFTGREIRNIKITHVLRGPKWGLADGWAMLSLNFLEARRRSAQGFLYHCLQ